MGCEHTPLQSRDTIGYSQITQMLWYLTCM